MTVTDTHRYTADQVLASFVYKAATYCASRYRNYGVTADDCAQEIYAWYYDRGEKKVDRWLASEPQQTSRIYFSFLDAARSYAEGEKARVAGYRPDDVAWYSVGLVESILPLAMDSSEDEYLTVDGTWQAMVIDVRRAVEGTHQTDYFTEKDASDVGWDDHVQRLVDWLGGNRPRVGRRKVLSNAAAQSITSEAY